MRNPFIHAELDALLDRPGSCAPARAWPCRERTCRSHRVDRHRFAAAGRAGDQVQPCGIVARSATTMRPLMSLLIASASFWISYAGRLRTRSHREARWSPGRGWAPEYRPCSAGHALDQDAFRTHRQTEVLGCKSGHAAVLHARFRAKLLKGRHHRGRD